MTMPLRVLFVEDNPDDVLLVERELQKGGFDPLVRRVERAETLSAALSQGVWDVVLVDYVMPNFSAPQALQLFQQRGLDLPFIVVSGSASEEIMVEVMKAGAHDYISKAKLTRLVPAIKRELRETQVRRARRHAEEEMHKSYDQMRRMLEGIVYALATTTEKRDPYTAGHQKRVSKLACQIAHKIGLAEARAEGLRIAALLHDIGKICVPTEILGRTGEITSSEFEIIKTHPQVAQDILKEINFPWPVGDIILSHHEKLNGSGYPAGLAGEQIPLEARILTVADVVEAMSSHRPYRPARRLSEALTELANNRGLLFDPLIVDSCITLFPKETRDEPLSGMAL